MKQAIEQKINTGRVYVQKHYKWQIVLQIRQLQLVTP